MFSDPIFAGQGGEQSLDIDAMLFDVSNRMARAQLARQISNSSSNFKRNAARVFKPRSTGNSPPKVQRRKTTTSYKCGRARSDLYNNQVALPHQGATNLNGDDLPMSTARPMSWHPSSVPSDRATTRASAYYTPSGQSMAVYQTTAVNNTNVPITQPTAGFGLVNPYLAQNVSSVSYQPLNSGYYENGHQGFNSNITYDDAIAGFDLASYSHYQNTSTLEGFPMFQPTSSLAENWANSLSSFPSYTNPPTPDFLPIQNPSDIWQAHVNDPAPSLPKRPSKELVGMGLYDGPARDSFVLETAMDQHFCDLVSHPTHESAGKGLKLEETWQPPEEDNFSEADSQDDEDSSSVVEVNRDVPTVSNGHDGAQGPPFAPYNDLSNQSFFFDNDEAYFDGMSFGQEIPAMSANLSGVVLSDYTWG